MCKPRIVVAAAASAAIMLMATAAPAPAGVVHPGETVVVNGAEFVMPEGPVLAQERTSFIAYYEPPFGANDLFVDQLQGTFTSTVVRDVTTGTLTFLYDVDLDGDAGASDASMLTIEGIAGSAATDMTGDLDFERIVLGARARDGTSLWLYSDDPGLGGAPRMAVRTDATAFTYSGTARFLATDDVRIQTEAGVHFESASAASVVGLFIPVPAEADEGGATPIPLPAAALSGLVALGAMGATRGIARFRRRRTPN